jgi:hypothetical protein
MHTQGVAGAVAGLQSVRLFRLGTPRDLGAGDSCCNRSRPLASHPGSLRRHHTNSWHLRTLQTVNAGECMLCSQIGAVTMNSCCELLLADLNKSTDTDVLLYGSPGCNS